MNLSIPTPFLVIIILAAIVVAIFVALYFLGKRVQKKQEEQDVAVQNTAQPVSMLVIDKKKVNIKKSGLPDAVIAQTPWYGRFSKVPLVKAKVGPQIITFISDPQIYNEIPVKKEVRAMVSGLYISSFKNLHGKMVVAKKKNGVFKRFLRFATGQ